MGTSDNRNITAKARRLRRNRDFQEVYRSGRFFSSQDMVLYCLFRPRSEPTRIGFSVARKTGKAVRRNRLRRRLREVARLHAHVLPAYGCDIIILGRTGAAEKNFKELSEIFLILSGRLTKWHKEKRGDKENLSITP